MRGDGIAGRLRDRHERLVLTRRHPPTPSSDGCEDCLRLGPDARWVHLRLCMTCGHVGCCDSSPNRHATAHWREQPDHPLVRSFEPGEDWWWCFVDELGFEVD